MLWILLVLCVHSSPGFANDSSGQSQPARISKEANGFYSYLPSYVGYTPSHSNSSNEGELKFQFSVKYELVKNWNWFFAYTQKSFWSIQEDSEPFRETNFSPETFWQYKPNNLTWLSAVQLGIYRHESTGESGAGSHGWDTSYVEPTFQWKGLYIIPRIWVPSILQGFDKDEAAPDNTDIFKYYGYWNITAVYGNKKSSQLSVMLQPARIDDTITYELQFDISWKKMADIFNNLTGFKYKPDWNPYYFIQVRDGYGESLKSYNEKTSSVVIGVSLIR
jgi:outer membrane phospholipase A